MAYEVLAIALLALVSAGVGFLFRNRSFADLMVPAKTIQLRQEIVTLTRQAEQVNSPATFAQHAKIMREVNKKKTQLEQTPDTRNPLLKMLKIDIALRGLSVVFILIYWGRTKIADIPADMLYPIMSRLSSVLWFVVCYSIVKRGAETVAAFTSSSKKVA